MPNLTNLDEKTAKLLLEERQVSSQYTIRMCRLSALMVGQTQQRINQEFSKLRRENQELVDKLGKVNERVETSSPKCVTHT